MSNVILDASAVLAILFGEPGASNVLRHIGNAAMSTVNYSESIAKAVEQGSSRENSVLEIARFRLQLMPFDANQAVIAAELREATRHVGCSFADRACLALAMSRQLPVLSCDRMWGNLDIGVKVELIR